jgi:hypothetical protein
MKEQPKNDEPVMVEKPCVEECAETEQVSLE